MDDEQIDSLTNECYDWVHKNGADPAPLFTKESLMYQKANGIHHSIFPHHPRFPRPELKDGDLAYFHNDPKVYTGGFFRSFPEHNLLYILSTDFIAPSNPTVRDLTLDSSFEKLIRSKDAYWCHSSLIFEIKKEGDLYVPKYNGTFAVRDYMINNVSELESLNL